MEEYELTGIILDKLEREYDEVLRLRNPEICLGDLIYIILKYDTKNERINELNISKNIFNKLLPKVFKEKENKVLLRIYLLSYTEYKKCTKCKVYKKLHYFGKHNKTFDKINCVCSECDALASKVYRLDNIDKCNKACRKHYKRNKSYYLAKKCQTQGSFIRIYT